MSVSTITKTAHQLRKGDVVRFYGGRFEITGDPVGSNSHHRPEGYWPEAGVGPSDCVASASVCLEGEVKGYFAPGTSWSFQGNHRALFEVNA